MNRRVLYIGLTLMAVSASGCIVINTERTESCRVQPVESESMTIREIDAVGTLSLESNREDGYRRIAQRKGLYTGAQVHLVKAVFEHLSLESSKMSVLLALVDNPCFCSEAKVALLDRLDQLSLENDRREILAAMSQED